MYSSAKMYCGIGPVSGAGSCLICSTLLGDRKKTLWRALFICINTALISENWLSVAMAQDGLANLKEGLEEAFADLGIPFQLKQVKDNLVLRKVESGEGYFIG